MRQPKSAPSSNRPKRKKVLRPLRKTPDKLIVPQSFATFVVAPDEVGSRLDQFLKKRLKWRSREKIQQLIVEREVTSSGARLDRAYKVKVGEEIRLPLPPPPEDANRIQEIPLEILYEDEILIVLNKAPNIVVHPAGRHKYDTLINALHLRYRNLEDAKSDIIPRLAHRIDRETSGVLVGYKMRRHDRRAPLVFEHQDVSKEYLALAEGVMADDEGVIDLPLAREPHENPGLALVVVTPGGSNARTGFRVVERFKEFTLVRCRLFTGRMHQIRAHLKALGHPIVCDKLHGVRRELWLSDIRPIGAKEENRLLLDRQALHSARIEFDHPATGERLRIEAPLPEDMRTTLEQLRKVGR
jgi:23S rRNA pseudouridine1911/1915/1917 synthase